MLNALTGGCCIELLERQGSPPFSGDVVIKTPVPLIGNVQNVCRWRGVGEDRRQSRACPAFDLRVKKRQDLHMACVCLRIRRNNVVGFAIPPIPSVAHSAFGVPSYGRHVAAFESMDDFALRNVGNLLARITQSRLQFVGMMHPRMKRLTRDAEYPCRGADISCMSEKRSFDSLFSGVAVARSWTALSVNARQTCRHTIHAQENRKTRHNAVASPRSTTAMCCSALWFEIGISFPSFRA
jgi:hypothetical protein